MKKKYFKYVFYVFVISLFIIDNYFYKENILVDNIRNSVVLNLEEENKELRKLLEYEKNNENKYLLGKVKYNNLYDFLNVLVIDKGSNDGVKKGDILVNDLGLIGIVDKVYKNESYVNLITKKNNQISVRVNESYGILKMNQDKLEVSNIKSNEEVKIGDLVYTSGIGNLPKNILVGVVDDIYLDELGLEKTLIINSKIDFHNLNYCFIIGEKS
ncbi:MAG: rod shape-determining protein MreC [Firmicutes bacterium]|nr:rod shape-determining protein MreC [Bacillota bacterium]